MKAIVTVLGRDRVGIIASVCALLSEYNINILDISQTILEQGYFTMVLLVDISACTVSFPEIADKLDASAPSAALPCASSGRTSSTPCTASERRSAPCSIKTTCCPPCR